MLGHLHFGDARHGWTADDRETALSKAEGYVERALAIDADNPDAHRSAAGLFLRSRSPRRLQAARKAAKLAPSLPDVLVFEFGAGLLRACSRGHRPYGKAIALSPNHQPSYLGMLGNSYRLAGRGEEAIRPSKASMRAVRLRIGRYGDASGAGRES